MRVGFSLGGGNSGLAGVLSPPSVMMHPNPSWLAEIVERDWSLTVNNTVLHVYETWRLTDL
jgi:hypothetical protein